MASDDEEMSYTSQDLERMDEDKLQYALITLIGVPEDDTGYAEHDVVRALADFGITVFSEFIGLTEDDIQDLVVPASVTAPEKPLMKTLRRKLVQLLSLYHYFSREIGGPLNIYSVKKAIFDEYRTGIYNPNDKILPWQIPLDTISKTEAEIMNWQKSVRPSRTDYKELRDDMHFIKWYESTFATLQSQGLEHLVDPKHVPSNPELDTKQKMWFYSVLQAICKHPIAKSIVTSHLADKDTRQIWKKITEKLGGSVSAEIHSQRISTYLTSTRLDTSNWRGTHANWLIHWREQARTHNEIAKDPFTDNQLIQFLNNAVAGTPHLAQVLKLHRLSARSSGRTLDWSFDEYVSELLEQAQVHDSGNTYSKNPRSRMSANLTAFDDNEYGDNYQDDDHLDTNVHDVDTPIEVLMSSSSRPPNSSQKTTRVLLNKDTWNSLSKSDQNSWDGVSEKGKLTILDYGAKRKAMSKPNSGQKPGFRTNVHVFDDDKTPDSQAGSDAVDANKHDTTESKEEKIEVGTHNINLFPKRSTALNKPVDPATLKTPTEVLNAHTFAIYGKDGSKFDDWDINKHLSQKSKIKTTGNKKSIAFKDQTSTKSEKVQKSDDGKTNVSKDDANLEVTTLSFDLERSEETPTAYDNRPVYEVSMHSIRKHDDKAKKDEGSKRKTPHSLSAFRELTETASRSVPVDRGVNRFVDSSGVKVIERYSADDKVLVRHPTDANKLKLTTFGKYQRENAKSHYDEMLSELSVDPTYLKRQKTRKKDPEEADTMKPPFSKVAKPSPHFAERIVPKADGSGHELLPSKDTRRSLAKKNREEFLAARSRRRPKDTHQALAARSRRHVLTHGPSEDEASDSEKKPPAKEKKKLPPKQDTELGSQDTRRQEESEITEETSNVSTNREDTKTPDEATIQETKVDDTTGPTDSTQATTATTVNAEPDASQTYAGKLKTSPSYSLRSQRTGNKSQPRHEEDWATVIAEAKQEAIKTLPSSNRKKNKKKSKDRRKSDPAKKTPTKKVDSSQAKSNKSPGFPYDKQDPPGTSRISEIRYNLASQLSVDPTLRHGVGYKPPRVQLDEQRVGNVVFHGFPDILTGYESPDRLTRDNDEVEDGFTQVIRRGRKSATPPRPLPNDTRHNSDSTNIYSVLEMEEEQPSTSRIRNTVSSDVQSENTSVDRRIHQQASQESGLTAEQTTVTQASSHGEQEAASEEKQDF